MRNAAKQSLARLVPAFALCAVLCWPTAAAWAAPTVGTPAEIAAKQAAKQAALAELQASRVRLDAMTSEFVQGAKELEQTRGEVSEVTSRLAQMDVVLQNAESALTSRAIELYRGDRVGMLELFLGAESIADLMLRANYLVTINERDARLLVDLRQARSETAWLQKHLAERIDRLAALQASADAQRKQIEQGIAAQAATAKRLDQDLAELMRPAPVAVTGASPNSSFNPETVISDSNYRAATSMSVEDIQAFLESQPGTLARYRAKDHNGTVRSVAEMIAEAAVAWRVSPKVILATLQKEQSLLSDTSVKRSQYDWAMGCGKADSFTSYKYQGFGKQIWFGASKLDKNASPWRLGIKRSIDGSVLQMTNASTYSLYMYTPHLTGTRSFWMLYWRYFGDPLAEATVLP